MSDYELAKRPVKDFSNPKHKYRMWADEIEDGFRHIYFRCLNSSCNEIVKIGNKAGSLSGPIRISGDGSVTPCIICPHCDNHLFVQLHGYVPLDTPDVFTAARK